MNLSEIKNKKILVIGDCILDRYLFGKVKRISSEAPVLINHITNIKDKLGGAANVIHNLALLQVQTYFLSSIGNDSNGNIIQQKLNQLSVRSFLIKDKKPTTTKTRVIASNQQMIRLDFEDATIVNSNVENKLIKKFKQIINEIDLVIISDYNKGLCSSYVCQSIIYICNKFNKLVIIDPKGNNWNKYSNANFIKPNYNEFKEIYQKKITNLNQAGIDIINQYKLDGLLITRSEKGMNLITKELQIYNKTEAKEIFDVSGAGDTVIAVFSLLLSLQANIVTAVKIANLAAGYVISKLGTYAINLKELKKIIKATI